MPTALIADPLSRSHTTPRGHPESPARFDAVLDALKPLTPKLQQEPARRATDEEILACHTEHYLATVKRDMAAGASELSTGDTSLSPGSLDAAYHAAGAAMSAVDAVFCGRAQNAFCVVRPPGHHACADFGMGFCIFNNIAIAARYAQRKYGIGKIAIADWDVHHGNGTQDIFYDDGSVLFFSTHQSPWYPGTGAVSETGKGPGLGCILNAPLPAGSGRREVLDVFSTRFLPAAERFKPELLLISAGFDSRLGDPLGRFTLEDADFAELTRMMLDLARSHANRRVVSILEGGYNLSGLGSAAAAHVQALMG